MNIKEFKRGSFRLAMLLVALLLVGAGEGFAQGGGGGGVRNGGRVLAGPTVTVTGPVLPSTPPAPDVLMRESFGAGAANLRPTGGKGSLRMYPDTSIAGFWIEYPGSKDTVWLAPPETGQTWRPCATVDNPYEMFSPLQVPPPWVGPDLAAIWGKNGCLISTWADSVADHPTALMPFKAPATAYQISLDVYPGATGPYVGFGLTGSSLLDSNLETSGSIWLEVKPGSAEFGAIITETYELRANGRTGPVLASGTIYNYDPNTRLVIRYDPVTKLASASVNEIELGVFPLNIASPKFIGIEGIGLVDNLVVRKLP
jgi:hypothetical protein